MSALIWIHEDALRLDHPVFERAGDAAEAVFIWDPAYFQSEGYSRKRLTFIYECLQDLNLTLYHGNTAQILSALADDRPIFMAETPNPALRSVAQNLRDNGFDVHIIADKPFAVVPPDTDMGRFFRFWNKARKTAMVPSYAAEATE